ncbi:MAG: hypothetical protein VSS75_025395 [Candidatus Parabeggiatoa sp.]|nr:hypothetical protein [Candidatus Parabeggiatoa sp.]
MMSNQAVQYESEWAENDFELQISLERAFAQLQGDDANGPLLKCLEAIALRTQNQSLHNIAVKIGIAYDDIQRYLVECKNRLIAYPPIKQCWQEINLPNNGLSLEARFVKSDKEVETWSDLLAGEFVPEADPKTVRETHILRAALLSHLDKSKEALPHPHIFKNVLARLEAEGLLEPETETSQSKPGYMAFFDWVKNWVKDKKGQPQGLTPTNVFHADEKCDNHQVPTIPWYRNPAYAFAFTLFFIGGVLAGLPLLYHLEQELFEGPSDTNTSAIKKGGPCLGKIINSQAETVATDLKKELNKLGVTEISLTVINNESIQAGWRLKANLKRGDFDALSKQYEGLRRYPPNPNYLCVNIISNEPE